MYSDLMSRNHYQAIPALDAIKGAVDAGKRSRNVSEQDQYKPGDFFRGLVQGKH